MERELMKRINQSIMSEHWFSQCLDQASQEDELFSRLGELVDQGIVTGEEAEDCYYDFVKTFHPDATIVHLPPEKPKFQPERYDVV